MAKKTDHTAERLEHWQWLIEDLRRYGAEYPATSEIVEKYIERLAGERVGVRGGQPTLSRAEEFFGLDVTKGVDAALLLRILADVVFSTERTSGRPRGSQKWNSERLFWLGMQRAIIEREQRGITDARAAEKIMGRYKQQYKDTTKEMIRQRLPQARRAWEERWAKYQAGIKARNVSHGEIISSASPDVLAAIKLRMYGDVE